MAQATGQVPYQAIGQIHQTLGDSGIIHDAAGCNEKGDCQIRGVLRHGDHPLHHQL